MIGDMQIESRNLAHFESINLQEVTILVGEDTGVGNQVLRSIYCYFNSGEKSNIGNSTTIRINGEIIATDAYEVLYLSPNIDAEYFIKITKKSLLGNCLENIFDDISEEVKEHGFLEFKTVLLAQLNDKCHELGIKGVMSDINFSLISKILDWEFTDGRLLNELGTFELKILAINLFRRLPTRKKKLLIVDLPEYGISEYEYEGLLHLIRENSKVINNTIIYTGRKNIINEWSSIYHYHFISKNHIWGMEDFDEILYDIMEYTGKTDEKSITEEFVTQIFHEEQFMNQYPYLISKYFMLDN